MTTAALSRAGASPAAQRPGLGRLTLVELRKMTDTRAGFWLQLAVVALTRARGPVRRPRRATRRTTTQTLHVSGRRSSPRRSCCRSSGSCSSRPSGRSARR